MNYRRRQNGQVYLEEAERRVDSTLSWVLLLGFGFALFLLFSTVIAGPLDETRYQGSPIRNADGTIHRSAAVLTAFQKWHPCPSTMKFTGACPGWAKNHVIPLACGGKDEVSNLQWVPTDIKSCSGPHCIDRFERYINAATPSYPDTASCVNKVVP